MPDATTILMAHVAKTLPNDIRHRRELLVAMRSMMTVRHPAWSAINQHIDRIDAILSSQNEMQLSFERLLAEDGR
jgi:hypothetical protein